jgi:hypothetical protein
MCFERIECRVEGPDQTISRVTREDFGGESLRFGFQERCEHEVLPLRKRFLGVRKGAEGTLVVSRVWHGERKTHKRPTQPLS